MNYYEHHIGDFDADTAHLSWLEDMAYTRLMRLYYRKEKPIPCDVSAACRLVRATSKEQIQAVESVLREFFCLLDDGWHQKRCDADVARFQAKAERNREVGKLGGRPRKVETQKEPSGLSVGLQTEPKRNPPQSPVSSLQTPEEKEIAPSELADSPKAGEPPPPPPFDGKNSQILNGKAVVALAQQWELPESWGVDAEALGWEPREVLFEAEKFRQYWTAGKGTGSRRAVKGWRQTWSNWLGKAAERKTR